MIGYRLDLGFEIFSNSGLAKPISAHPILTLSDSLLIKMIVKLKNPPNPNSFRTLLHALGS